MEIFKLFGSILVDSSKAEDSISKTGEKAEGLGGKLGNGIKTAAKWGAALGAAALAVGGAMLAAAGKVAGAADEIDKASRRAGTDAETWQKLKYAMGQSGISAEQLEKSMVKNQQALNKAASGVSAYSDAYDKLRVSIYDSTGKLKDSDDVYQESLKALADMEDINQRNALANQLFGKSYADLAPILDAGSEGINQLTSRAEQLGLVLSQKTVDAGVKFGDTLDDVKQVGGSVFNMIAAELLPVLQGFLDWIIASAPTIQRVVGDVVAFVQSVISDFQKFWEEHGEQIKKITSVVFNTIKVIVEEAINVIKGIIEFVLAVISGDWEGAWNALVDVTSGVLKLIGTLIQTGFEAVVAIIKGVGKALFNAGKAALQSVWDGMKSVWESISNWVSEKVNWLADKLAFWRKSKEEMGGSEDKPKSKIDGSHASGLAYVPYDGYVAELHRGETVLNADSSKSMVEDIVNAIGTIFSSANIGGGAPVIINVQLDKRTIAQAIYDPLNDVAKQRGVALG